VHQSSAWHCTCGFAKPLDDTTILREELFMDGVAVPLELSIPGRFNEANAALAITALKEVGVSPLDAAQRLKDLHGVAGRFTLRKWQGRRLQLLLAKNPSGFEALLSTIADDASDPSWLYDVPFEQLRGHRVWCLGDRRLDLATRLEYADVDFEVVDDIDVLPVAPEPVLLLANYTAFSEWLTRSSLC
jgi:hypothetical protein